MNVLSARLGKSYGSAMEAKALSGSKLGHCPTPSHPGIPMVGLRELGVE